MQDFVGMGSAELDAAQFVASVWERKGVEIWEVELPQVHLAQRDSVSKPER